MLRRFAGLCVLILLCGHWTKAQTLAHPGWHGNGIASQAWWKHANFVRLGPDTTFLDATHTLDAMSQAGIDSLILPDLQPAAGATLPWNERFGTQGELDTLLREASARRMHVLVGMPVARLSTGGGEVRFWTTRGIAGFQVDAASAGDLSVLRGVRSEMSRFPGERILIGRSIDAASSGGPNRDPITLHILDADASGRAQASSPSAIEVPTMESLTAWHAGTVPIFAAAMLATEADRARIHGLLAQRSNDLLRIPRRR